MKKWSIALMYLFVRPAPRGTAQYVEEQFLSKIFLWVAILFVLWLIFAWPPESIPLPTGRVLHPYWLACHHRCASVCLHFGSRLYLNFPHFLYVCLIKLLVGSYILLCTYTASECWWTNERCCGVWIESLLYSIKVWCGSLAIVVVFVSDNLHTVFNLTLHCSRCRLNLASNEICYLLRLLKYIYVKTKGARLSTLTQLVCLWM